MPDVNEKVGREEAEVAGVAHSPRNLAGAKRVGVGAVRPRKGPDVCLLLHTQTVAQSLQV